MSIQATIREEELKNRVAAAYFSKYDCGRIVGNIDFCVSPKRRDPHQMTFIPDAPILWAEAKNHPTDVHRMLAQLILTIGRAGRPRPADAARPEAAPYQSDLFADARDARSYQASTLQDSKTPSSESNASTRNPNPVNPVTPVKKENLTVFRTYDSFGRTVTFADTAVRPLSCTSRCGKVLYAHFIPYRYGTGTGVFVAE